MEFLIKLVNEVTLVGFILTFAAYVIGIKFPDWDFKFKLKHRSILTHSPLVLFFMMYLLKEGDSFRYFFIGFALAMGIHFIFDLFPKGWSGGALLKIPIIGINLSPRVSQFFFVVFIGISLVLSINHTASLFEYIYLFVLGILSLAQNMKKEKKLFRPLIAYILLFFVLGSMKYDEIGNFFVTGATTIKTETIKYYKQLKNSFS